MDRRKPRTRSAICESLQKTPDFSVSARTGEPCIEARNASNLDENYSRGSPNAMRRTTNVFGNGRLARRSLWGASTKLMMEVCPNDPPPRT